MGADTLDVINPATEESVATIAMGGPADVDAAVAAARAAFATYSLATVDERLDAQFLQVALLRQKPLRRHSSGRSTPGKRREVDMRRDVLVSDPNVRIRR